MCSICDDEKVGDEIILQSTDCPCFKNAAMFLDLAICRKDKWRAEIQAWATLGGIRSPLLIASKAINYCPQCGRRLSLRDAGKEK